MAPRFASLRSLWRDARRPQLAVRAGLLVAAFALALYAHASVTTTAGPPLGLLPAAYVSLRLFILEYYGFPLRVPGEPAWALWAALFACPAITAAALVDAIAFIRQRLSSAQARIDGYHDHVVVCGFGRHGRVVAEAALSAGRDVVVLDAALGAEWVEALGRRVPAVRGDMTSADALAQAGVERASEVWFVSGEALTNLNAALLAKSRARDDHDTAYIPMVDSGDDERFLLECYGYTTQAQRSSPPASSPPAPAKAPSAPASASAARLLQVALPSERAPCKRVLLFDQYSCAARRLLDLPDVAALFGGASERPLVAVVGYGRFGEAVAKTIEQSRPQSALLVIDRNADHLAAARVELASTPTLVRSDAAAWIATYDGPPLCAVFLCTDDDVGNLRCATLARKRGAIAQAGILTVVRLLQPPVDLRQKLSEPTPRSMIAYSVLELLRDDLGARFAARPGKRGSGSADAPPAGPRRP